MNAINFLSGLMSSYNDYITTVERSREILKSADLYNDADFEMLRQRATDISIQTAAEFCDVMPCVVGEYIKNRGNSNDA